MMGVAGIIVWQAFVARIAGTVARGGDCVAALDGSCVGGAAAGGGAAALIAAPSLRPAGAPALVPVGSSLPVGAAVGSSSLSWGAPGFTQGWTPAERERYLAEHGVADPDVRYFTPFWEAGPPNYYTGAPDTGGANTFGVIHDYNIGRGDWPWVADYFDVVTPLFGRTHGDIDQAATRIGHAIDRALGRKGATR
ncbi:MAG: hypothetical protein LC659_01405 [Myxococcales bacterium]|nr:hypothetical protein [Myxococcales bacterium]